MKDIILILIEQLNSSVIILLIILITIGWLLYKGGSLVTKFGVFDNEIKDIKKDVRDIKDNVSGIDATVKLLYQAYLGTVKTKSPLHISPKGDKIVKDLSLSNKVDKYWDQIYKLLSVNSLNNPYDVQIASLEISQNKIKDILTENEINEIKIYAFNNGLNLLEIYPVIGVLIRDKALKEIGFKTIK
ncbi:MAG: hypothetical protein ACFFG0_56730 [Candidatus Thorarchaeota archaeon]